ncbi:predicted protein [Fibroporia radiculosa]|uniref:Uncharacterized protein n=1 Tax=Fibroporia radiculosa TaxID=599839 RepID=J7SCA1_9APHY|nr:predicted protein [Fibroporia radiculosa]
MSSNIYQLA